MLAGAAGVNGLANELYVALNVPFPIPAIEGTPQSQVDADRKTWCDVVASVIIAHIQANAAVSTAVSVASVSAVTVGLGTSGPGAGTGTGTVA